VLEGAHATVPCFACHEELQLPPAETTLIISASAVRNLPFDKRRESCDSCHEDTHAGQFAERADRGTCSGCHDQLSFANTPYFDHDRDARFKLRGAHANVKCDECHREESTSAGRTIVRYRPLPMACRDCHR
jgi:hypothetical protein